MCAHLAPVFEGCCERCGMVLKPEEVPAPTVRMPALGLISAVHQSIGTHGIIDWLVDQAGVVFASRSSEGRDWTLTAPEESEVS